MLTIKSVTPANPLKASVRVLGLYVRGMILIFIWQLVLYSAGFAIVRLPWWLFLALVCAVLGLLPRIGSLIGIAAVLFLAWLADATVAQLAWTGGIWVAVQAIEGFWLTPGLLGKPLGLRPMAVFLALMAGSILFGPIGLLVAVPVLAIAMVWVRYFRGRSSANLRINRTNS